MHSAHYVRESTLATLAYPHERVVSGVRHLVRVPSRSTTIQTIPGANTRSKRRSVPRRSSSCLNRCDVPSRDPYRPPRSDDPTRNLYCSPRCDDPSRQRSYTARRDEPQHPRPGHRPERRPASYPLTATNPLFPGRIQSKRLAASWSQPAVTSLHDATSQHQLVQVHATCQVDFGPCDLPCHYVSSRRTPSTHLYNLFTATSLPAPAQSNATHLPTLQRPIFRATTLLPPSLVPATRLPTPDRIPRDYLVHIVLLRRPLSILADATSIRRTAPASVRLPTATCDRLLSWRQHQPPSTQIPPRRRATPDLSESLRRVNIDSAPGDAPTTGLARPPRRYPPNPSSSSTQRRPMPLCSCATAHIMLIQPTATSRAVLIPCLITTRRSGTTRRARSRPVIPPRRDEPRPAATTPSNPNLRDTPLRCISAPCDMSCRYSFSLFCATALADPVRFPHTSLRQAVPATFRSIPRLCDKPDPVRPLRFDATIRSSTGHTRATSPPETDQALHEATALAVSCPPRATIHNLLVLVAYTPRKRPAGSCRAPGRSRSLRRAIDSLNSVMHDQLTAFRNLL